MKISIIIPAHNEEKYIGKCLDSIEQAKKGYLHQVETIVVLNRCTDNTEQIALSNHAKVIIDDSRNLSMIRNAGVKASSGEIIVTIDADSVMSKTALTEIYKALSSNKYIGGGTKILLERYSFPLRLTYMFILILCYTRGISAGMFWCYKRDFDAVGGFDEKLLIAEDLDLAYKLKKYGKQQKKKYIMLPNAYIVTSCRKFDKFGDWLVFKLIFLQPKLVWDSMRMKSLKFINEYFYDFNN